ncbi:MAG: tRNA pseudouridine(38-40) synthase TruA, partial [Crocinitomicaceae bacterium]|nr:tRNA pseudouridine(38-40) synthase TruA [Crocinitomicaceae bacterium]
QAQPNGNSIQAEIEKSLRRLLRQEKVVTQGCGRTDSGVHARNFYLHFNAKQPIEEREKILFRLNQMLPWDLAVHGIYKMHDKAHARFDAIERSYEYHIHEKRDPFIHSYSAYYPFPLNVEKMNEAAQLLVMKGDFASFCKTGGGQKTTLCDVRRAEWESEINRLVFHITADRFLRNMVRAIVGTLIKVGREKMTVEEFKEVIAGKKRVMAGDSARASGLHLTEIRYPYHEELLGGANFTITKL